MRLLNPNQQPSRNSEHQSTPSIFDCPATPRKNADPDGLDPKPPSAWLNEADRKMSDPSVYTAASLRRRFCAFIVNFLLLSIPAYSVKFTEAETGAIIGPLLAAVMILISCVLPESPGKRLVNLIIVDQKMTPIGARLRLFRAAPIFVFFATLNSSGAIENRDWMAINGVILTIALFFIFANALAVYFSPWNQSFFDMKLCTRVVTPRKLLGQEITRIWGVKVW